MPSQHKHRPIPFRPPEGDRAALLAYAERTGEPVNRVLARALAAFLAVEGGNTVRQVVNPPQAPAAKRERKARPAPAMTPAPPAVEAPSHNGATCGHGFPDVKFRMGQRVCRKCGPPGALQ